MIGLILIILVSFCIGYLTAEVVRSLDRRRCKANETEFRALNRRKRD